MSPLRANPTAAYVAPLAVFLLFSALVPLVAIENRALPWWRFAPEHWIYPLQVVLSLALLAFFWPHYTFRPWHGFALATVLAVVGIVCWIFPAWLFVRMGAAPGSGISFLGFAPRLKGFDPTLFEQSPTWFAAVVGLRFLRLVVVVPLVEEIFWRGFVMRYVVASDPDFQKVPFGRHHPISYGVTTVLFMFSHAKEDWLGALVFGSLMYWLCIRTKSLAACVWMHAVANLLLGIYVMQTRQWGFW